MRPRLLRSAPFVAAVVITAGGSCLLANDPVVELAIDEAKRKYPPGDHPHDHQVARPESHYISDEKIFSSPNGEVFVRTIRPRSAEENNVSGIVDVVRKSDGRVLISVQESEIRLLTALWSPDSGRVAVSFKTLDNSRKLRVFAISGDAGAELLLPDNLNIKRLLSANDPAQRFTFNQVEIRPVQWQSGSDLICEIVAVSRRMNSLAEQGQEVPTSGFVTIGYRVTVHFSREKSTLLASERTQYELNE